MTVLDYILDGIEAELALERELGVRSVECDRSVLAVVAPAHVPTPVAQSRIAPSRSHAPSTKTLQTPQTPQTSQVAQTSQAALFDFVFLHDRPLSPGGVAMMAKIIPAMGKTLDTAPIVIAGEIPKAKAYVILGRNALKKWLPGTPGAPGQWAETTLLPNALITYSPEYILRFGEVTPGVKQLKREMWSNLKSVLQRVRGI